MKSVEDIKKYFQKSTLSTNPDIHEAIFEKIKRAQDQSRAKAPALSGFNLRSKIMKSSIIKLAAVAVIIVAALLGITQLGGSTTSVVWADVAQRVEASQGLTYRGRASNSGNIDLEGDDGPDYSMNYLSTMHWRTDDYKGEKVIRTFYRDYEAKNGFAVFHTVRRFISEPLSVESTQKHKEQMNPKWLMQSILSCRHKKLGRKTIDGVLCEGLETNDPAFFGSEMPAEISIIDAQLQLWVNVETNLPVLFEGKRTLEFDGNVIKSELHLDQFQWDVELDASIFEPNIPPDYEQM